MSSQPVNSNINTPSYQAKNIASSVSDELVIKKKHLLMGIDQSDSMRYYLSELTEHLNIMLGHLREQFYQSEVTVTVYGFSNPDQFEIIQPMISLKDFSIVPNLQIKGGTGLYSTIIRVDKMIQLPEYQDGNIIHILLTDGDDTTSNPDDSKEKVTEILQGYLNTLQSSERWISFIFAGANQDAIRTVSEFKLPETSALTFQVGYFKGCFDAIGNMLERVVSGEDSTPSIQTDDRQLSCPVDEDFDSPCFITRRQSAPSNYQNMLSITSCGPTNDHIQSEYNYNDYNVQSYVPNDYFQSEYDDSVPSYVP